jgi:O-antigen/teichoic acid export membrane protein
MRTLRSRLAPRSIPDQLRSVGGTTIALIGAQVAMAVAGVVAARELGPAGRGVVTAVVSWPIVIGHLSLVGLNTAASVRVARGGRSSLSGALASAAVHSAVVGGTVTLIAILLIPPTLSHLGQDASGLATWALATIPTIVLADILMSVNVALGRLAVANWCRVIGPVLLLAGTLLLAVRNAVTPERVVAITIASWLVSLLCAAIGLPWRRIALSVRELLADLRFGAKAHLASLVGIANVRLDLVLMSVFVSASQVGYYGVANNMMMPVTSLAAAAAILITPRIAGMPSADRHPGIAPAQLHSIRQDARRYVLISVVGAALLAALAPVAVPLVFGPAFQPVVVLVWVLIPGYIARTYAGLVTAGALGIRRTWIGNAAEGAGFVVTAALLPILLGRYGALGAAITSTVAYGTSAIVALYALRRLARQAGLRSPPMTAERDELGSSPSVTAVATRGG